MKIEHSRPNSQRGGISSVRSGTKRWRQFRLDNPGRTRPLAMRILSAAVLAALLSAASLETAQAAVVPIPDKFAQPASAADATQPGFIVNWSQVNSVGDYSLNSNLRTEAQLAGLLGPNVADPNVAGAASGAGKAIGGANDPIQFIIPKVVNLSKTQGDSNGNFTPDDQEPGTPGTNGGTDNQAAEFLTWLKLDAGTYTVGVNSDDGFALWIGGYSPKDAVNRVLVGQFDGGRGAADTIMQFSVSKAGLYPMRVAWENGTGGSNIEIFSEKADGTKVLINDTANGGIPAFRALTGVTLPLIVTELFPPVGAAVPPDAAIIAKVQDGSSALDANSIKMTLNGTSIAVTPAKSGNVTTIAYTPPAVLLPLSQQSVKITYTSGGAPGEIDDSFSVINFVYLAKAMQVTPDTSKPGFIANWSQVSSTGGFVQNSTARTEAQLAGLLGKNVADPTVIGPATGQGVLADGPNGPFEFDIPTVINMDKAAGAFGHFGTADQEPGTPGTNGGTDNQAAEFLTFITFPTAGAYTMGVTSDDGFKTTAGNVKDVFAAEFGGEFNGGRGAADTTFLVQVNDPGTYPFRTIWENGGGSSSVSWWTSTTDAQGNTTYHLIDDASDPLALKAYRATVGPSRPLRVASVSPAIGATDVRADTGVFVQFIDGLTKLDPASVKISINGAAATAAKSGSSGTNVFTVASAGLLASGSTNTVTLIFSDMSAPAVTSTDTWSFVVQTYGPLDVTLMSPVGSGDATQPGFRVKVNQIAPASGTTDDSIEAAEQQLAGLFGPNVANLTGADANGYFSIAAVINWDRGANDGSNGEDGNFTSANGYPENPIPGIPGSTGSFESIAAEIQTYVEFPAAGYYQLGVNSDDGFRVTEAEKPGRLAALEVTAPASIAKMYGTQPAIPDDGGLAVPLPLYPQQPLLTGKLVLADPLIADTPLNNAAAIKGNIALIQRGSITFEEKIQHAQAAGAIAVVVYNREDQTGNPPLVMSGDSTNVSGIHIPAVMISFDDGVTITNHLNDPGGVQVQFGNDGSSLRLGQFDTGRGSADTLFSFLVTQPGVYPLRCVYEQGGGGANIEWFSVNKDGTKVLLNDSKNSAALKTFRARKAVTQPKFTSFALQNGKFAIAWSGGGTLQTASAVTGPWTDVANAANPYTVAPSGAMAFFRIKQ